MNKMRKQKETEPLSPDDKAFFHEFYEDNKNFMFYIARKYVSTQTDCEDIVQEATVRLINNVPSLRELTPNKTAKYIALTIRSVFMDFEKRKHGSRTVFLDDDMLETLIKAEVLIADGIPDISARMEVELLKQSLEPRDWLVLEGKYLLGYTQEELAPKLGVSPDSVRMILSRARANARKILQCEEKVGGGTNAR